jgi:aspartyl-tRNA(Asn)/glutamyl-tRNA(Gln) amidotransferase subunit C
MAEEKHKAISIKQVEHLAELVRVELSDDEKRAFTEQLNTILEYFHVLDEADTKNVLPTFSVLGLVNVWRQDVPSMIIPPEKIVSTVPRVVKGFVKAPRMV